MRSRASRCAASATARGCGRSGAASLSWSSVSLARCALFLPSALSRELADAPHSQIRARRRTLLVGVLLHPQGAIELRFVKPSFSYKAGQWLYLNVPELSRFQWHPFTISSAPDDPYISVHIRQVGDWTQCVRSRLLLFPPRLARRVSLTAVSRRALGARLGCTPHVAASLSASGTSRASFFPVVLDDDKAAASPNPASDFYDVTLAALMAGGELPAIRVDGPYGAPAQDVFKAEGAHGPPLSRSTLARPALMLPSRSQSPFSSAPASASRRSRRSSRISGASPLPRPPLALGARPAHSSFAAAQVHGAAAQARRAAARHARLDRARHGQHGLVCVAPPPARAGPCAPSRSWARASS